MTLHFAYNPRDLVTEVRRGGGASEPARFDAELQAGWRDRADRGLFRYTLGDLQTRILPGQHRFVAQLNPLRATRRRKPQEIRSIRQEFSPELFNFNQVRPEEVLLELERGPRPSRVRGPEPSRVRVLVNVSPLEFGHCLLVPDPHLCLPQVLTRAAVQAGMETVLLSGDPDFRVGFNSLGAFASVNHLHLHTYYLPLQTAKFINQSAHILRNRLFQDNTAESLYTYQTTQTKPAHPPI